MIRYWWLAVLVLVAGSCTGVTVKEGSSGNGGVPGQMKYATGFTIRKESGFKILEVRDPWQNIRGVTFTYLLASDPAKIPDSLSNFPFIQVPVHRVVALSTTHIAMIRQLGMGRTIKGISGTGMVYDREFAARIHDGDILDVGYEQGLDYEAVVRTDPDVLFFYGVESSGQAVVKKLGELKVPVVYCGEYLERHPLGKAEWIRFFAQFYQMEEESERFFNGIDSAYQALASIARGLEDRPAVLTGLPWNDTWYMAGGKSFASRFIRDAGGAYLWEDNPSAQAVALDLESVYARAVDAEIWINPGAAKSLEELRKFDLRFGELPVVKNGMVFNNNRRLNETGGNDYWESGTVRPDLVLADLIEVFHPDLLTDHHFIYYRKLK